jgi:hypothetical protein
MSRRPYEIRLDQQPDGSSWLFMWLFAGLFVVLVVACAFVI